MTEKHKRPSDESLRLAGKVLADSENADPSSWERAAGDCWDAAARMETSLALMIRGLNNGAEHVRYKAFQWLLLAFPSAETRLSHLAKDFQSDDPKVRLAAIGRVIIILAEVMAALAGMKPKESSTAGGEPEHVTEDLMEHAGRWVAWTRDRKRILAVADSFAAAMDQAEAAGESDPYVRKAPGVAPTIARKPFELLEDESPDIIEDIRKVFPDAEAWLNAPNDSLGGQKPKEFIGTARELELRYLLRGIEDGITT